ncbi:MAG: hypothetical protein N3A61_07425 [Ignavibacteria bacterium]|nr:hypothetical protein [Ignavibacteria bacterium]
MFDREKQIVINRYSDFIFKDSSSVKLNRILSFSMHESLKRYFDQEIESRLTRELDEIKKFSIFNYDLPEAQPFLNQAFTLMKLNKTFNRSEFATTLKFALDFNIDYLLRPCESLTNFVYDFNESLNSKVILTRLKYVLIYEYLPKILTQYFIKTNLDKLKKSDFLNLVRKADKEYTKDFTLENHYEHFKAFKSFLRSLEFTITPQAEIEAFQIFLTDKDQTYLASIVNDRKNELTDEYKDLGEFISYISIAKAPIEKKSEGSLFETVTEVPKSTRTEITIPESKLDAEPAEEIRSSIKYEKKFSLKKEYSAHSEEFVPTQVIKEEEKVQPEVENPLLQKLKKSSEEKTTEQYDRNLDGLIGNRLRRLIIKKLFNGVEGDYLATISFLDRVKDWDEASQYLTDLFHRKSIQPFSKPALKFTEFLYSHIR